jgi:CRISPR-associated protein Cmr4
MQNFKIHSYLIECLSNLHVGSGDANYDVIDKKVQRDPVTNLPCIHSSGIKGAFREYFDQIFPKVTHANGKKYRNIWKR